MTKRYEELTFADDFMFSKVLENDKELCKEIIELILERKVLDIGNPVKQKEIKPRYEGKGVRLDVYLDGEKVVYDIEMQTVVKRNLPRRTRFYQSSIDSVLLDTGNDYENLKDMIIVFICLDEPFSAGYPKYTFKNICVENTNIKLGDGVTKIFLNANGSRDNVSPKMKAFLDYLVTKKPCDNLTAKIHKSVSRAIKQEEWREEYKMFANLVYLDAKAEAREEGLAEGRAEGRAEGHAEGLIEGKLKKLIKQIICKIKKDKSIEIISDELEEDVDTVKRIYNIAIKHAPEFDVDAIYEELNK